MYRLCIVYVSFGVFWKCKKDDHDGTRTHNPQIRSLVRYPLRHEVRKTTRFSVLMSESEAILYLYNIFARLDVTFCPATAVHNTKSCPYWLLVLPNNSGTRCPPPIYVPPCERHCLFNPPTVLANPHTTYPHPTWTVSPSPNIVAVQKTLHAIPPAATLPVFQTPPPIKNLSSDPLVCRISNIPNYKPVLHLKKCHSQHQREKY